MNLFNYIEERMNFLAYRIESRGRLNLLDLHLHSENFYLQLCNKLFGWQLMNMNTIKQNAEAIDLIDHTKKLVVQVSATATKKKIESALSKDLSGYSGYSFKFISISKDANSLRNMAFVNPHSLTFDPMVDIYDIPSLLRHIGSLKVNDQKQIADLLFMELRADVDPVSITGTAEVAYIPSLPDQPRFGSPDPILQIQQLVSVVPDYWDTQSGQTALVEFRQNRRERGLAIVGPKGSGKTELAYNIATILASEYWATFVVHCAQGGRTVAEQRSLAAAAGLQNGYATLSEILEAISRRIPQDQRWLLLVDDIPDEEWARQNLPKCNNLDMIVTSNNTEWHRWAVSRLDYLSEDETLKCVSFLSRDAIPKTLARTIYRATSGMFVMLRQAVPLATRNPSAISELAPEKMFLQVIRNVEAESPEGIGLLAILSLLDGNRIPLLLLSREELRTKSNLDTVSSILDRWTDPAQVLEKHGLIRFRFESDNDIYESADWLRFGVVSIHSVIQKAMQRARPELVSQFACDMLQIVGETFSYDWSDQCSHANAPPLWPHIQSLLSYFRMNAQPAEWSEVFRSKFLQVLENATSYEYFNHDFTGALSYSDWARDLGVEGFCDIERVEGGAVAEEFRTRVEWYHNRATIMMQIGHFDEAHCLAQCAYQLCEQDSRLDEAQREHKVCGFIGCDGCTYRAAGRHEDALTRYSEAITRLAKVESLDNLSLQVLVEASSRIPNIFYWQPLHTFGGLLLNCAIEKSNLGEGEAAVRLVELACESLDRSGLNYHIWSGMANYYAWRLNKDIDRNIRAEEWRIRAVDVLSRPIPPFVCMGDVRAMRSELGITSLKPFPLELQLSSMSGRIYVNRPKELV